MIYVFSISHSFVVSLTIYVTSLVFFFFKYLLMFINYQQNALIIALNFCFCASELPALLVIALNFCFCTPELPALIK